MNNISQSEVLLQDAMSEVGSFLRKYQVSDILKQCNGYKQKGFSVIQLFAYMVTLMFQPLSTYMSMRVGAYKEPVSKNTIRRFCNNASINWHKFLRVLSQKLVVEFMRPATSENREEFFIIDDTPFQKSGKKTELVSKFFNHVSMKYNFGYRILTLLWTDGYSNVPVCFFGRKQHLFRDSVMYRCAYPIPVMVFLHHKPVKKNLRRSAAGNAPLCAKYITGHFLTDGTAPAFRSLFYTGADLPGAEVNPEGIWE